MLTPNAAPPVKVAIWPIRSRELVTVTERTSAGMMIALRSAGAITSVVTLSNVPLNFGSNFNALASDANGLLYGTGRGSGAQLATINTTTGVITSIGVFNFGEADALTFGFAPVPEPSTVALMLLGLLGAGVARRRKGSKIG